MTAAARRRLNPSVFPFNVRRYRAADLALADGAAVSSWADRYGSADSLVQATGSKQPLYSAAGGVGGRPGVSFDGTDDSLSVNGLSSWFSGLNAEVTIFVVAKPTSFATTAKSLVGAGRSTNTIVVSNYRLTTGGQLETSRRGDANETLSTFTSTTAETVNVGALFTLRHKGESDGAWTNGAVRLDNETRGSSSSMTVDRVSVGCLPRSSESLFFQGVISDVVLVQGACTTYQRTLIATELALEYGLTLTQQEADSSTRVIDMFRSWWNVPAGVVVNGETWMSGVSALGSYGAAKLGLPPDRHWVNKQSSDDHNTPSILVASGKPPIVFFDDHTGSQQGLRWRKWPSNDSFAGQPGVMQTKTASVAGQTAYTQSYNRPGTNDIVVFTRIGNSTWHVFRSTDYAATFNASLTFLDFLSTNQGYMITRQKSDGNLRLACYGHPVLSSVHDVYYCDINLATGDVTKLDGTVIGNIITGSGLPLAPQSTMDVVHVTPAVPAGSGTRLTDVSDGPNIEIAFITWTSDTNAVYSYTRWNGSAWVENSIVAAGAIMGFDAATHYHGGMSFPEDSPGGIVYISRESSGTWTIEKCVTSDGGSTWTRTVLASSSERKLVRPYAMRSTDPHPLLYVDASHYGLDFNDYTGDLVGLTSV